jgi:ATP-dependent DNA helicase PIF1
MTQDETLAILKTGANVFLTGEPGSGKTHTVNRYVAWLRERGIQPAVTASTGIAATHINGHTIHSWSGIGIRRDLTASDLKRIAGNPRVANRIRSAHTLIIDEISMLSASTFRVAEASCRHVRGVPAPFGGLQVVLVGDFFQLPPVVARAEAEMEQVDVDGNRLFDMRPRVSSSSVFAFNSPVWDSLKLNTCYLSEQYRQDDPVFLNMLSAIRSGKVSADHRALLESRFAKEVADGVTQFFSHNADVDRVNALKLAKLPGEAHTFEMESRGPENLIERLVRGCLSPEKLSLKIGAQVMFTKNDILRRQFVNGTIGKVIGFGTVDGAPIVQTAKGQIVTTEPSEWGIEEGNKVLAQITQIPLRLAWAITVHKSQGMSLDAAHMDLSDAFEHGQGYVAISRVRTLAGLSLAGFNDRALEVHPDIAVRDVVFRAASAAAQEGMASLPVAELARRQSEFVRACGGEG